MNVQGGRFPVTFIPMPVLLYTHHHTERTGERGRPRKSWRSSSASVIRPPDAPLRSCPPSAHLKPAESKAILKSQPHVRSGTLRTTTQGRNGSDHFISF